ncbi:MAG: excinuclease ABC subunit UvrA, partial [Clostridia bacterium]|nr:excinuclease ABC subunit UvrA [Clostridia bacterium]
MKKDIICIKGAREHNLKNIDINIPRDQFVVLTGLSGSGKSSLAFDTIYAEGQRRYVESLSAYARQFLGLMEKPDVDSIEGLSPAISIDQKTTSRNPRSTVGTVTEIYDYLRLLYARIGIPHCPNCGKEIYQQSIDQMIDMVMQLPEGARIQLLAPVIRGKKGEHVKLLEHIRKEGYVRVRIDGQMLELSEEIELEKNKKHTIEVVVDRLIVRENIQQRLTDSLETVLELSGGIALVDIIDGEDLLFNQNYACVDCGIGIEEMDPRMFSFNTPYGACETCSGLGTMMEIDPGNLIINENLSLAEGAIEAPGWNMSIDNGVAQMYIKAMAKHYGFKLTTPLKDLDEKYINLILYGTHGEKFKISYSRGQGNS